MLGPRGHRNQRVLLLSSRRLIDSVRVVFGKVPHQYGRSYSGTGTPFYSLLSSAFAGSRPCGTRVRMLSWRKRRSDGISPIAGQQTASSGLARRSRRALRFVMPTRHGMWVWGFATCWHGSTTSSVGGCRSGAGRLGVLYRDGPVVERSIALVIHRNGASAWANRVLPGTMGAQASGAMEHQ